MKMNFKHTPKCEICKCNDATHFSADGSGPTYKNWQYTCSECDLKGHEYPIPITDFFASPNSILDWISHMYQKPGMDWLGFIDMLYKFDCEVKDEECFLEERTK
jgi:hypothetical protein